MTIIRKAKPEDSESIIDFQQKMAWETEHLTLDPVILEEGVKAVFENPERGSYWVAEKDELVIASLLITHEWSDWRNSDIWWFQSVFVMPGHRRTGVFRSMYSFIRDEAERLGIAGLRLYVETNNHLAQRTYEALGMSSEHYTMYEWLKNE
jgi:GNAT superfamily N-acetyltransferase